MLFLDGAEHPWVVMQLKLHLSINYYKYERGQKQMINYYPMTLCAAPKWQRKYSKNINAGL